MESTKYIEYIREKLNEKGINTEIQDYVIEYIEMNQILFGSFLDIGKVTDRIVNNLNHEAKAFSGIRYITKCDGFWSAYEHTIYINPLRSLLRKEKRIKPIIMHELDHCATTTYVDIGDEKRERYIEKCLKNSSSLSIKKLEKYLKETNGKIPIVGIRDDRQLNSLDGLNEGITEYKNEKYCRFLGIKPLIKRYTVEKMVAQFIAETIGEKNLISMHFDNDYEGIRKAFELETGKDLDLLVSNMNFIVFKMQLSCVPLMVAKREMIEELNNYKVKAKNEKEKGSTDTTDTLVKVYEETEIYDGDVKKAYKTLEGTKAEREQTRDTKAQHFKLNGKKIDKKEGETK